MSSGDPLSAVESLAHSNDWVFERLAQDEISILVDGRWASYQASFSWLADQEVLHLACGFEMKVVPHRLTEVKELIGLINQELWVGHFDLWGQDGMVFFRHGLLFPNDLQPTAHQCGLLLQTAIEACEDHYPAFNFVLWAGKPARESLDAVHALSTVEGEA